MLNINSLVGLSMISFGYSLSLADSLAAINSSYQNSYACITPENDKNCHCDIKIPQVCLKFCNVFKSIAEKTCRSYSGFLHRRQCFNEKANNVKVCNYVEKTLKYICEKVGKKEFKHLRERARKILCCIDKNLDGSLKEFALFTASALHNTSYFKIFVDNTHCDPDYKYKSRGLLMITHKDNYKHLQEISGNWPSYVESPRCLEKPSCEQVCNTIKFWKYIMKKHKMSFEGMLKALNPYTCKQKNCKVENCYGKACEAERKKIYEDLKALYKK